MSLPESTVRALPKELATRVDAWADRLVAALGESLVGAAIYGGLAKGDYVPGRSDVNVALVLTAATPAVLDRLIPLVNEGARDWLLAPWVLTERDLRRATDVFPTKFLDLQRHHLLVCGRDVLGDLDVPHEHLRLRCEQELTNLHLRLRQTYLRRTARPELLETTLRRSLPALLANLGTLLELENKRPLATRNEILAAASASGLDVAAVERVQAIRTGAARPKPEEWRDLYAAFMVTVEKAVDRADGSAR
jgi:hypothetical protein